MEPTAMKRLTLTFVFLAFATAAAAQSRTVDSRWAPFVGCWETPQAAGGVRVCVERSGVNSVSLVTSVAGQQALEQTIFADGVDHPVNDAECHGTQRAEWSRDGQQLFAHAELTCKDEKSRTVSGLAMIAPNGRWLDIQNVKVDAKSTIRVRRYRHISGGEATASRPAPLTLDAIKDASRKVDPQVVDAALVETDAHFDLTSRSLIELADAGVPPTLIDVMIALSYPKHFVVERTAQQTAPPLVPLAFGDPFFYGDLYSAYYYTPFAYRYAGYPGFYPYIYGDIIYVDGGGVPPKDQIHPSGRGQVVDGFGYTRVRPRDAQPEPASSGGTSAATSGKGTAAATTQGYTRGASAPIAESSGNPSSSGSSSGSSASGGSSSGGSSNSGSDTGRTAVPR
jgi:hypothetical protein